MSALGIRRAVPQDAGRLSELGAHTFAETFAPSNTPQDLADYLAAAFAPSIQAAELAVPGSWFLIAEQAHRPVAYARLLPGPAPVPLTAVRPLELVRFYVLAALHGQGTAAALMQVCLEQATAAGHDLLWLGVWQRNHRARAFYRKWGFTVVGRKSFLLGSDLQTDDVMARALEPVAALPPATWPCP